VVYGLRFNENERESLYDLFCTYYGITATMDATRPQRRRTTEKYLEKTIFVTHKSISTHKTK